MKYLFSIFPILFLVAVFGGLAASGQTLPFNDASYAAPVSWTEYRIPSQKISVVFPKLPVARNASNPCSQTDGTQYHAYANGVVYEFEWHAKSKEPIPSWCTQKIKFLKDLFSERLKELKAQNWAYVESQGTVADISATVLRSTATIGSTEKARWLIWDKDRWFELGVSHRKGTTIDEARLLGGLKLSSSNGLDVGSGSESTLGDSDVDLKSDFEGKNREGLVIVTKPRPAYTDSARQSNTQGTVMLRVTFLRNGGVGSVSVVKALPYGLTEQAIAAAKKISFLPGTVNGKPISIIKQVEYSFSIY